MSDRRRSTKLDYRVILIRLMCEIPKLDPDELEDLIELIELLKAMVEEAKSRLEENPWHSGVVMNEIVFFVIDGRVCAFNHDSHDLEFLILPTRECNQWSEFKDIMLAAESDLAGKPDGKYRFTPETDWQKAKLYDFEDIAYKLCKDYIATRIKEEHRKGYQDVDE